jgi:hypothetical protein
LVVGAQITAVLLNVLAGRPDIFEVLSNLCPVVVVVVVTTNVTPVRPNEDKML